MKILLDENLPKKLLLDIGAEHEVFRVQNMQWHGKKNGELLGLMTLNGFDILITMDKNLRYQQNLHRFPISIIVLDIFHSKYEALQLLVPQILECLRNEIPASSIIEIRLNNS
jgi:predicted nuclease of predicted toxin-antitoxin system